MKRIFAFLIAVLVATTVYAGQLVTTACTSDHKSAVLSLVLVDGTSKTIEDEIKVAFTKAAHALDADALVTSEGFAEFKSNLSEDDFAAIEALTGPPVIGGTCKGA